MGKGALRSSRIGARQGWMSPSPFRERREISATARTLSVKLVALAMFAKMPVVCNRVQETQNVLAGGPVEAIGEHCVCGSLVVRQLDLGIIDDDLSSVLDSQFAADLHWNFELVFHR